MPKQPKKPIFKVSEYQNKLVLSGRSYQQPKKTRAYSKGSTK